MCETVSYAVPPYAGGYRWIKRFRNPLAFISYKVCMQQISYVLTTSSSASDRELSVETLMMTNTTA
jgi:hypothetical protein